MPWMELIRIRTGRNQEEALKSRLKGLLACHERAAHTFEVHVYGHAAFPGDVVLLLRWETNRPEERGSLPGLGLVQALKEFGLVEHTVWIEETD